MHSEGKFQDPFCRKEFWIGQLHGKSKQELEAHLRDFARFSAEAEKEFRFVMTRNRADVCREALEEVLREKTRQGKNKNQGDLFSDLFAA